jgi:hypothetical protein
MEGFEAGGVEHSLRLETCLAEGRSLLGNHGQFCAAYVIRNKLSSNTLFAKTEGRDECHMRRERGEREREIERGM